MLVELIIQNIILIDHAQIQFERGFNVLSGETGSGKSAVMEALQLALGARTDIALIRHGADKGIVEAIFDVTELSLCQQLLAEKGLAEEDSDTLIIKREISSNGKTRAFINHHAVTLSLLKQIGEQLLELVGQHANHKLFELSHQRHLLDLYGGHLSELKAYTAAWQDEQNLLQELIQLQGQLPSAIREMETCEREITEIEAVEMKEGEEEELYQEYSLLATSEERAHAAHAIEEALATIQSIFRKTKHSVNALEQRDPSFAKQLAPLSVAQLEIEELLHTVQRYRDKLEANPFRLEELNERLALYKRLKRKYGLTVDEIYAHLENQKQRLNALQNLEQKIQEVQDRKQEAHLRMCKLAQSLTNLRTQTAAELMQKMDEQLAELNMPGAHLRIAIGPGEPTSFGADHIEFCLSSNLGEKEIPLREGTSGGELARILLALHLLLAGKEQLGTIIFDEIDANIGGTTAALIGHKLKTLGGTLQVLCITHFPQVAESADHHLQILKTTQEGRTFSQITVLTPSMRNQELARMRGKT